MRKLLVAELEWHGFQIISYGDEEEQDDMLRGLEGQPWFMATVGVQGAVLCNCLWKMLRAFVNGFTAVAESSQEKAFIQTKIYTITTVV